MRPDNFFAFFSFFYIPVAGFVQIFSSLTVVFTVPWPAGFATFLKFPPFKLLDVDMNAIFAEIDPCSFKLRFLDSFVLHVSSLLICLFLFLSSIPHSSSLTLLPLPSPPPSLQDVDAAGVGHRCSSCCTSVHSSN